MLGRQDSNLRMSAPKADALPLGDAPPLHAGPDNTDNNGKSQYGINPEKVVTLQEIPHAVFLFEQAYIPANHYVSVMVKVKICGIRSLEDALCACEAGADALGFNFSSRSPRNIGPEDAAAIIAELPPFIACTGIFVEHSPQEINSICTRCRLQAAQLHSSRYTTETARAVTSVRVIRVFRPEPGFDIAMVRKFARESGVNSFLFDAYRPEMEGGTGERIEQGMAAAIFEELRGFGYAILAGGLNPENVASAVQLTRPWAVDTASGVERSPGIKSHEKIRAFIDAAKNA